MKKRLLLMTSILALVVASMSGCGSSSSSATSEIPKVTASDEASVEAKTFKFDQTLENSTTNQYALAASNDNYELYFDKDVNSICVKQKSTGQIWSSDLEPEQMGVSSESILPKTVKKYASPFQVTYFNTTKDSAATVSAFTTEFDLTKDGVKTSALKDGSNVVGIRAEYPIDKNGNDKDIAITVTVDYYLTEDGFEVRLPVDGLKEEGDYAVTKIALLPYFASASNDNNGYYMYPDGSGAIMEFKDSAHNGEQPVNYNIYGNLVNYKNSLNEWDEEDAEVFMPIFGGNVENRSYLGIITKGEETATVTVSPVTGEKDPFNHLYATFEYRKSFDDQRYAVAGSNKTVLTFDKEINNVERVISYHLYKSGDDTTYADMASTYRDFLLDSGIKPQQETADKIPVSIDFFMGINEPGMVFDKFQTVTTFDQVDKMLVTLNDSGVEAIEAQLKGWTKNGYYTDPVQFPVNSDVGGASGLKSLTDKYKDDDNVKICLETNLLEAKAKEKEFNINTDTITLGNYLVFSDYSEKMFLLSPNASYGKLKDMVDQDEKNKSDGIDGYSFYSLGQYLLYNYNSTNKMTLTQCKLIWENMMNLSKETYGTAIAEGGNQYVLFSADKVTDIPYEDSGYRITTKNVPVFQIALHGLIEYTGDPGNLSSNLTEEKLKWVEFGYVPYFELTYTGSENLMYTDYNKLFSSEFKTWKNEVVNVYDDFNKNLSNVWNAYIVGHEEVATDVYKVTYDNDAVVYVNYSDQEYKAEDGSVVGAESYLVID